LGPVPTLSSAEAESPTSFVSSSLPILVFAAILLPPLAVSSLSLNTLYKTNLATDKLEGYTRHFQQNFVSPGHRLPIDNSV
jgi:hypothetical protein